MVVGVVCSDGVVLGSEKVITSKLMIPQTDKRIYSISRHAGIVVNGVIPDGRNIMYRGRKELTAYQDMFGIEITGKVLAERLGGYMH
jgi:20S proteasome subunit alpha 7